MPNGRRPRPALPNTRRLTIVAQDPAVRIGRRRILTTAIEIPAEQLAPGPCGYRVKVVDYDASSDALYAPAVFGARRGRRARDPARDYDDPYRLEGAWTPDYDRRLLRDPRFHAQNVYAIAMRVLARFELALGRRVAWGCNGHQLHIAPHAFADANAFYSEPDRGLFFGYFAAAQGPVFTCLAHDVVAHETTHALLDGLRDRYTEPSSPDQSAFHEGFADIVALLSVFSLGDVVETLLDLGSPQRTGRRGMIDSRALTRAALQQSVLLGLAKQMGEELSRVRGQALRRSVALPPGQPYMDLEEFREPHRRGELVVAAMMNAFLDIWLKRLAKLGNVAGGFKDRSLVAEEGARVAEHLLTMAIRAIDYCPPTDITFADYLSGLLTIDREIVPDDSRYGYRDALLASFRGYGIAPSPKSGDDGAWLRFGGRLLYGRTHFDSMLRDHQEVFRFIWENRRVLRLYKDGYTDVESVRPCIRVGPDGFVLRESVAEYVEIMTLPASELSRVLHVTPPPDMPPSRRVRMFGGGALVFDEYGQLKYRIANELDDAKRQQARLDYLWASGFFEEPPEPRPRIAQSPFVQMHLARATR